MTQPFGYHSQNSPSKPQAALSIRHEQVHFNPVFFSFNFVSKAFPCKNVISQFVSYLNRTEALKPELIFTSPEIGNTKQLDNWSSPVTPPGKESGNAGIWIHLPHRCRSDWRLLVPSVSREKLPLPGKTAAPPARGISNPWSLTVKSFLSLHLLNLGKIPQGQRRTGPPRWRSGAGESSAA